MKRQENFIQNQVRTLTWAFAFGGKHFNKKVARAASEKTWPTAGHIQWLILDRLRGKL